MVLPASVLPAGCQSREVRQGQALYASQCARCHGEEGVGQDPRRPFGGIDPALGPIAPALNGRGHCWYHPPGELFQIVKDGSSVPGSPMPAWGDRLSDTQIRAVIAYLHSLWPRYIQRQYGRIDGA
jgi:mono/diheme cytochrome c family protein